LDWVFHTQSSDYDQRIKVSKIVMDDSIPEKITEAKRINV